MARSDLRLLGIDPSINATGLALPDGSTRLLRPEPGLKGPERLHDLRNRVTFVLSRYQPNGVVLEDYAYKAKGASVLQIAEWGGVLRLLLHDWRLPVAYVNPATLKRFATGKGNAGKETVMAALGEASGRLFPGDNEADAYGLLSMGYAAAGAPLWPLNTAQRNALGKVQWPW